MADKEVIMINIDWNSLKSIELAEKSKESLENNGYMIVEQITGMTKSILFYGKITNLPKI